MSSTKMKGLLKGLRYISQIFDEEKEEEMQIGNPTDVKHVAHIGWDGPAAGAVVDSSPSWALYEDGTENETSSSYLPPSQRAGTELKTKSFMKEFSSTTGFSAPLGPPPDSNEGPEVKWVSEDSKRGHNRAAAASSAKKDLPELPKSSRRHSDNSNSNDSPRKQKPRQSRRQQAKDALDSVLKSGQESTSSSVPNIPRKSRRKKSKEINGGDGGSTRSRTKGTPSNSTENVCSDPGLGPDTSPALVKNQDLA